MAGVAHNHELELARMKRGNASVAVFCLGQLFLEICQSDSSIWWIIGLTVVTSILAFAFSFVLFVILHLFLRIFQDTAERRENTAIGLISGVGISHLWFFAPSLVVKFTSLFVPVADGVSLAAEFTAKIFPWVEIVLGCYFYGFQIYTLLRFGIGFEDRPGVLRVVRNWFAGEHHELFPYRYFSIGLIVGLVLGCILFFVFPSVVTLSPFFLFLHVFVFVAQ